ncbi:MAG: dihydroxyacetone kinase subunit L [Anaerolineaceae bacterium]|nr:dihydroxyacetone kinase subunit L [Anaerolineaceae bacterium]
MAVTRDEVISWIKAYSQVIEENKEYLTELDSAIGDADHGANMQRGFQAVLAKLPAVEDKDIGTIFKTVGMTLISTVGGAGGPLYGTFFIQAGTKLHEKMELILADWAAALEAGTSGVVNLGKACVGDKTMIDALTPAVQALNGSSGQELSMSEALKKSAKAAEEGMKGTIPLVARKGRASYLGERSAGHQDPGATSSFLLLDTAVNVWAKH